MNELDEILAKSFLQEFSELEKKRIQDNQEHRDIAKVKHDELKNIEKFLQKLIELDIHVQHCDQNTPTYIQKSNYKEPKKFEFYYGDSSKKWSPGISIFFDHPAQVEIAIPNNVEEEGVVVIHVISHHPYSYLLEQKFLNYSSAYESLAKFLAKCTLKVNKDTKKYSKEITSLEDIPNDPPNNFSLSKQQNFEKMDSQNIALQTVIKLFQISKNKNI